MAGIAQTDEATVGSERVAQARGRRTIGAALRRARRRSQLTTLRLFQRLRGPGNKRRAYGFSVRLAALFMAVSLAMTLTYFDEAPPWQGVWFDRLQQDFPRAIPDDSPVRVVAIETGIGGQLTRGMWPRDKIAELVDVIGGAGARMIGLDILLDQTGMFEQITAQTGAASPEAYTDALAEAIERHHVVVPTIMFDAEGLERRPTAMVVQRPTTQRKVGIGRGGFSLTDRGNSGVDRGSGRGIGLRAATDTREVNAATAALEAYPIMLQEVGANQRLIAAADGAGLTVNQFVADSTLRSLPLVQVYAPDGAPTSRRDSMVVEMLRFDPDIVAKTQRLRRAGFRDPAAPFVDMMLADAGVAVTDGAPVPLDSEGTMRLNFRPVDKGIYVRASDLVPYPEGVERAPVDLSEFRDRFVIITTGYGEFAGPVSTPVFDFATTGEILAQAIEQIRDGDHIYRPAWFSTAETVVLGVTGLGVAILFGVWSPVLMVILSVGLIVGIMASGVLGFAVFGLLTDSLGVALGLGMVSAISLATSLIERDRDHRDTQLVLADERAEKSRIEAELDVARQIQMGLLPPRDVTPTEGLEISCHIQPAREVGGDFYDHMERADGKVFTVVADVSGKGVPASLFMAMSKSLWKSAALSADTLEEVQTRANADITRDNHDDMFVTGVACLYDPETEDLHYSGAGHDMPILARADGSCETLEERSGPPMGLVDGMPYPTGTVTLRPGDMLCLFTDGLSEAEFAGPQAGFFGIAGMLDAVASARENTVTAREAVRSILRYLDDRTRGAEQTDDRTIVIVRRTADEIGTVDA